MEGFVKGDVIIVPFPFSDLSSLKNRPALVIATLKSDDIILCQITSQLRYDNYSIPLQEKEFEEGYLNTISNIRPDKLFTADRKKVLYKVGKIKPLKIKEVENSIINIIKS